MKTEKEKPVRVQIGCDMYRLVFDREISITKLSEYLDKHNVFLLTKEVVNYED